LAPGNAEDELGPPGVGFETGGSRWAGGIVGTEWQRQLVGSVPLNVGETHFFTMQSVSPIKAHNSRTGEWAQLLSATRCAGDREQWCAVPSKVLQSEVVGSGLRVRAVGNGMGEVWVYSAWDGKFADGRTVRGLMARVWIVPVGAEARAKLEASQGKQPTTAPGTLAGVLPKVAITGRVVMRGTREPVADAQIQLVYPEGGVVFLPDWKTGEDGRFHIVAGPELPGGGLPANEYEVFVYKGSDDARADPLTAANTSLWPVKRYMVQVTQEAAAQGNIPVGAVITMDYVENIDFTRREAATQGGGLYAPVPGKGYSSD